MVPLASHSLGEAGGGGGEARNQSKASPLTQVLEEHKLPARSEKFSVECSNQLPTPFSWTHDLETVFLVFPIYCSV